MEVFGVSFDPVEVNAAFAAKFSFPFRLLSDLDRTTGLAYGATFPGDLGGARRISYLIGADGRIERVYDKVAARTHPEDVLAAL